MIRKLNPSYGGNVTKKDINNLIDETNSDILNIKKEIISQLTDVLPKITPIVPLAPVVPDLLTVAPLAPVVPDLLTLAPVVPTVLALEPLVALVAEIVATANARPKFVPEYRAYQITEA